MIEPASPAVRAYRLTKAYNLYQRHGDRLKEALHPFRKKYHTTFHALRNVSFEIAAAEAVGILGRNGSGKSTLLKIITGVLTPSSGKVSVRGEVSAILELGAGFNPELSGIENIRFRGTILGRNTKETERMIPDIVSFADIGEHIHQPVKTYSSGMFARLAFALAVNVNPEILIVDEALSVGDIRFQQKCIRKMQDFRDQGKTILFVTHSTSMVTKFCDRALWLDRGQVREFGPAESVCKHYMAFMAYGEGDGDAPQKQVQAIKKTPLRDGAAIPWIDLAGLECFGSGAASILRAALLTKDGPVSVGLVKPGQELRLLMQVRANRVIADAGCGLLVKNRLGQSMFALNNWYLDQAMTLHPGPTPATISFTFRFPDLTHGRYTFSLAVAEGTLLNHVQHHWIHDALVFDVGGGTTAHGSDCLAALPTNLWSMHLA